MGYLENLASTLAVLYEDTAGMTRGRKQKIPENRKDSRNLKSACWEIQFHGLSTTDLQIPKSLEHNHTDMKQSPRSNDMVIPLQLYTLT
jgi:hypothetical protein